jgi:hypothetical protein
MLKHQRIKIWILTIIVSPGINTSVTLADILDLSCATTDSSRTFGLTVDRSTRLVSNQSSYSGRQWAAHVSDQDVVWDEIYDDRRGHVTQHYVLERPTGALHGTNVAGAISGREILSAVCKKSP